MKMLLEVVRESSDALPPLKGVVGGIVALLDKYDVSGSMNTPQNLLIIRKQFISNKEDVRRLIARVDSLTTLLTKPPQENDISEIERRNKLRRLVGSN
jgi:hypothetical protein